MRRDPNQGTCWSADVCHSRISVNSGANPKASGRPTVTAGIRNENAAIARDTSLPATSTSVTATKLVSEYPTLVEELPSHTADRAPNDREPGVYSAGNRVWKATTEATL